MQISTTNYAQNFKGLNFYNVSTIDREHFVRTSFKELQALGEKYDIRLTSCYANSPYLSAIEIDVKPLKKGLNFIQKLFRPTETKTFISGYARPDEIFATKEDFMKAVHNTIQCLKNKVNLHK